jgi:isoleucyl-tRNA synthetase
LPDELRPVAEHFGSDLRFLLKVSEVIEGDPGAESLASESIPGLRVGVARAEGSKCPRCWNVERGVGTDEHYPQVCPRCADALRVILGDRGGTA